MSSTNRSSVKALTGKTSRVFFTRLPHGQLAAGRCCLAWLRCWLALLMTLSGSGCGGESNPPPTVVQPPQVRNTSRPVGFARRTIEEPEQLDEFAGVDPDDMFAVSESAPPNYVIITGLAPESRPEDRFDASANPADPSLYFIEASPDGADRMSETAVALPMGFIPVPGCPIIGGRFSRITSKVDRSEMVLIPLGESIIGTSEGPADCVPEVSLSISAFYISVMEVSVAQYSEFRSMSVRLGKAIEKPLNVDDPPDHPVTGITWGNARAYAQSTRRELPTECQWEKAARGAIGLSAPWGDGRPLWSEPRKAGQIDPCGNFHDDRSIYGVFDMAGNAREWMLDFYSKTNHPTLMAIDSDRRADWSGPRRPSSSGERVVKGDGPEWAVWIRRGRSMTDRSPSVGFRCVLNLTPLR